MAKAIAPTAYQRAILSVPEQYNLLLAGGRGGGKALDLLTPIPTPAGWTLLKDIVVGETVFDEHGVPCKVVGVFDRTPDKAYRLHFSDHTTLDACDEHQWVTWTHAQRKAFLRHDKTPAKGLPEDWAAAPVRTTQQIVDTLTFGKRGDTNHCIPTAGALQTVTADLPVEPYLLGIWLGDGTSNNGNITTMDPEVLQAFEASGFAPQKIKGNSNGKASTYAMGPIMASRRGLPRGTWSTAWAQSLSDLGVVRNKHVPSLYMRANVEQRLALLQGLMDSDGYASLDKRCVEFCNTNKLLVDAVTELARSLGEKPVVAHGRAMLKGVDCGDKWRVTWRATVPCFRLPRKLSRTQGYTTQESRSLHRMIVKAEEIPPVPMRCIMVDSPNHMYLAGEGMIPTHNSVCLMMLLLRHIEAFGDLAYALLVRESYEAIKQLEEDFELLCLQAYGKRVKHNKTEHTFYFPAGGKVQFGQLKDQQDYVKYQGKSYTMLIVDEYGEISNPRWITLLMSNIRGPKGMPLRTVFAANPGGAQHGFLHGGFIAVSNPWQPFVRDDGETWVCCPSTWRDNPNINHVDYLRKLRAACGNDEELFKAWDTGDWAIARGAYFAGALEARIHKIPSSIFPISKLSRTWQPFIAMDWGSGAPGVAYICGESPGVPGYPKGSLILCDELASYDPGDQSMNTGLNWSPGKWADALKEKAALWGCPLEGVCDEAYGIEETLLQKFAELGLHFNKPKKERVAGWQMMRNMLVATRDRTGQPGLWISDRCEYFWKTVPFLQRDVKYPEDLNTKGPDHGADACFVDGTIISAAQGDVEIDTLKPGHQVFTRAGLRPVVKVGSRKSETFDLLLSNGVKLTGTGEHPFWVEANKTWEPLARLQQGTELTTTSGLTSIYVESVHPNKVQVVRNLEVADQPEYYANGVLVHNCRYGILNLGRYAFSTKVVGQY